MAIAAGPDEFAGLEIALLRQHVREQRVRGDVERHAEEDVGAALVELAAQPSVRHVELEERVAGHELHLVELAHVPGAHDDAARIRIGAQLLHHLGDLVDVPAVGRRPVAPLLAVHGSELAAGVGPLVPDGDAVIAQVLRVGLAAQEPQQLVGDRLEVHALGGHQRKSRGEIEAHLVAEHRQRAGAGAIGLARAVAAHVAHEFEILLHGVSGRLRRCREIARRLAPPVRHEQQREADEQHGQRQQHAHGEPVRSPAR